MAYKKRNDSMSLHIHVHDADSLTPPRRGVAFSSSEESKNIWLVRHGEAEHNCNSDWGLRDPSLTHRGHKQAKALKFHPMLREALGFVNQERMAGLVVVSPLRRALQTAQMMAESMRSHGGATHPWVPIIANPDLQELTDGPNDTGHPPQVLSVEFPEVDFSLVPEDWHDKRKTGNVRGLERAIRFCNWLAARPEEGVVCIGHLDFFKELTGVTLKNCGAANFIFSNAGWKCQHALPKPKPSPSESETPALLFTPMTVSSEARKCLLTPSSSRKSALKGRGEMYVEQDHEATPVTDSKDPHAEETAVALFQLLVQKMEHPEKKPVAVKPTAAASKAVLAFLDERNTEERDEAPAAEAEEEEGDYVERGKLAGWLVEMGVSARQAEQLVTHIACTARTRRPLASLSHVVQDDFVQAVAHPKFLRLRLLVAPRLAPPLSALGVSSPSLSHASTPYNYAASASRSSPGLHGFATSSTTLRHSTASTSHPEGGAPSGPYLRSPASDASSPSLLHGGASPSARRNIFLASSQIPPAAASPSAKRSSLSPDDRPTSPPKTSFSPTLRPPSALPWNRNPPPSSAASSAPPSRSTPLRRDSLRAPTDGRQLPLPAAAAGSHRGHVAQPSYAASVRANGHAAAHQLREAPAPSEMRGRDAARPAPLQPGRSWRVNTPFRAGSMPTMFSATPPRQGQQDLANLNLGGPGPGPSTGPTRGSVTVAPSPQGRRDVADERAAERRVWAAEERVVQLAEALAAAKDELSALTCPLPRDPP